MDGGWWEIHEAVEWPRRQEDDAPQDGHIKWMDGRRPDGAYVAAEVRTHRLPRGLFPAIFGVRHTHLKFEFDLNLNCLVRRY